MKQHRLVRVLGLQKVSDSDILYAYNNFSTKEAVEYLGINSSTYYNRLNKLGIVNKQTKTPDEVIIEAFNSSKSIREAANKIGMSPGAYHKRIQKLGIDFKDKHDTRKYKVNDNVFSILSPETAYWLGFIAADGSVVDNTLRFVLNRRDEETLQRFLDFCDSNYPVNYHTAHYTDNDGVKHEFDAVNLKITSKKIVADLAKYGIVQNKKNMDIPFIQYIPEEYKVDFIIGFFDGDGSVTPESYNLTLSSNRLNAQEIIFTLSKLGIQYSIGRRNVTVIYINNMVNYGKFKKIYLNRTYNTMVRKRNKFLLK